MSRRNEGIPQLTSQEKLEQIRSGKKIQRRKSGLDVKDIVVSGKDGSTIKKKEMAEKYEETTVRRKKKNYVMYESKLGTQKNTEITTIAAPKPKKQKIIREPEPRVEEVIVLKKKKKEYLDNYQYHETKVLRKKNASVVEHKRLGDIIFGEKIETVYQRKVFGQGQGQTSQTIQAYNVSNRRIPKNRSDMINIKPQAATATNFYTRAQAPLNNVKSPDSGTKVKSQIVVKQIMSRRGAPSQASTIEINKNTINSQRNQPRTPAPSNSRINQRNNQRTNTPAVNQRSNASTTNQRTNTPAVNQRNNAQSNFQRSSSRNDVRSNTPANNQRSNARRNRVQESVSTKTITATTSVRRRNNESPGTKSVTRIETRVERRRNEPQTIEVNKEVNRVIAQNRRRK